MGLLDTLQQLPGLLNQGYQEWSQDPEKADRLKRQIDYLKNGPSAEPQIMAEHPSAQGNLESAMESVPMAGGSTLIKDAPNVLKPFYTLTVDELKSFLSNKDVLKRFWKNVEGYNPTQIQNKVKESVMSALMPSYDAARALVKIGGSETGRKLGESSDKYLRWLGRPYLKNRGEYWSLLPEELGGYSGVMLGRPEAWSQWINTAGHEAGHHAIAMEPGLAEKIYSYMEKHPGWSDDMMLRLRNAAGSEGSMHKEDWLRIPEEAIARDMGHRFSRDVGVSPSQIAGDLARKKGLDSYMYDKEYYENSFPRWGNEEINSALDKIYKAMF